MNIYSTVVESLHNAYPDLPWNANPSGGDAKTLYPNVAAEWLNSKYHFSTVCRYANISPEILVRIVEDGEPMKRLEITNLMLLWRCDADYLTAATLQTIDPSTNKGKRRLWELHDLSAKIDLHSTDYYTPLIEEAKIAVDSDAFIYYIHMDDCARHIPPLIEALLDGKVVTYAWFRHVTEEAYRSLSLRNECRCRKPRSCRII